MTDPVAVLIGAMERWEHAARTMPKYPTAHTLDLEARAKEHAIAALHLPNCRFHELVANIRRRHIAGQPGGMHMPDAVQTALLELGHHPKEAS